MKVYNTLIDKVNNNLIFIIQDYNIHINKKDLVLIDVLYATRWLKYLLDINNNSKNYYIEKIDISWTLYKRQLL